PMKKTATVLREYGPFPGSPKVGGVTFDGKQVWMALGDKLAALDPDSGQVGRAIEVAAHAGTAFDGRHLYQIAEARIQKIDPFTGQVIATIPAPANGGDSRMAWAQGSLWGGHYPGRKSYPGGPATGKVPRTIQSNRFGTRA